MRIKRLLMLLSLSAAPGLAACGGSGSETFEQEGYPFTFEYPGDLTPSTDITIDTESVGPPTTPPRLRSTTPTGS